MGGQELPPTTRGERPGDLVCVSGMLVLGYDVRIIGGQDAEVGVL